jgi:hypothetical protein
LFDDQRTSEVQPLYIEIIGPDGAIGFALMQVLRSRIQDGLLVGSAQHFRIDTTDRSAAYSSQDFWPSRVRLAVQILARLSLLLVSLATADQLFLSAIIEQAFGALVPAGDDPLEAFADDGVVGRLQHC